MAFEGEIGNGVSVVCICSLCFECGVLVCWVFGWCGACVLWCGGAVWCYVGYLAVVVRVCCGVVVMCCVILCVCDECLTSVVGCAVVVGFVFWGWVLF